MLVYLITNLADGKKYVGASTRSLDERIAGHIWSAFNDKETKPLYEAMRQYGIAGFKWEVLAETDSQSEMWLIERDQIVLHDCMVPKGYNQTLGHGGWWKDKKRGPMSEEHREKISKAGKGRRAWNLGVPHTYEARLKMRGRPTWNKGIARTEAEKAKMREAIAASRAHGNQHPRARAIECDGKVYPSIRDMERRTGMSRPGIYYRLHTGRAKFVDRVKETA